MLLILPECASERVLLALLAVSVSRRKFGLAIDLKRKVYLTVRSYYEIPRHKTKPPPLEAGFWMDPPLERAD